MLNEVFAAAWTVCGDEETAAEVTRRVLVAGGDAVLGARLAATRVAQYAGMAPDDRDAVVLARALGYKTDEIASVLDTTPADVRARIGRGLRTLLPPRDCVGAASPAHDARGS
ncbi:sigma factor-like helix-turn-helix DNA-binding protein [Solirubrobacter soli]|uniref:sigma-70 region 4 domain-containing protein n=1 Tax=Solirubrobacter soli TaxID=363832 RepID=UPI0012FAA3D9|nr:sigma-70 region 4 domain-containing protein [Solirubrobacter soli]